MLAKNGSPCHAFACLVTSTMEDSAATSNVSSEEGGNLDLVEGVYLHLTAARYPTGFTNAKKRAIRKKAQKFVVRRGVLFFKKKRKGRVRLTVCKLAQLRVPVYITFIVFSL